MNILLLILFSIHFLSPDTEREILSLNEDLIAQNTVYFDINSGTFIGADSLTASLEQAHFVALGELHNRINLGELTEALLHTLEPHGFNYFAVETGPYSAQKLQNLIRESKPEVSAFYATYSSRLFDIIPIPFFEGQTDLRFLSTADALGYELWGMDQEFYFSYIYLIDELAALAGESITRNQLRLHRKLTRKISRLDRRNQFMELFISSFHRSCRIKNDADFQTYLQSFANSDDPDIQLILDALRQTTEIYCLAEKGEVSEPRRIKYFKENFNRNFEESLQANQEPKVFLKMGSFHMGRQRSPLNLYDIGNHIYQLAESRSQSSVHIYYLNRFVAGKDMKGQRGWEGFERFLSVGEREKWTLTDLRPLREQLLNGTLHGTDWERRVIQNYDFIIIAPEDDWVERHW
ncbi:MAG: hypothetical protein LAT77_01790 [Aliidiomarina sp.]|uniref:hypothetical protein n=1 Tax=Aliidiomarina sp. TaxID=1872439 RepID=UPI0025BE5754|nr:hypothetical protein [Aliidiomarina sp.]MCH8500622.1 hypothetical protein [Aliidiomarina sp.]